MTISVDFYITQDKTPWLQACRLIEQVYQQHQQIYIHFSDEAAASHLDELLWTFSDTSFIPHALHGHAQDAEGVTVWLGYGAVPDAIKGEVFINFATPIPIQYSRFARVIEIVPNDPEWKERLREHYRYYREQQCLIATHKLISDISGKGN